MASAAHMGVNQGEAGATVVAALIEDRYLQLPVVLEPDLEGDLDQRRPIEAVPEVQHVGSDVDAGHACILASR